ncbi:MAG TPA: DUF4135 domain-containing protein [Streptosporangiaceae bacterium]|nr:DUF4135 domain-containing protein [Streptosporangiaceae bacterium]
MRSGDDPPNLAATLPGQRIYRASLYLRRLQATRTFLTNTLTQLPPAGLGANYPFFRTALESTALINALALELDQWTVPAVEKALSLLMPVPNSLVGYQNYFVNSILNANDLVFDGNVNGFFGQYPITDNALNQITNNFQQNIKLACERIAADLVPIRDLFIDRYPNLTLLSLKAIKSTGSDFHKGGKQVLILTFGARWWSGWQPKWFDLRLVYKPADLEADCLLAGESAAVNQATGGVFMAQSLVEIFNAQVLANPGAGTELLPTYRILPMHRTSVAVGAPVPIRAAYGYLEFLAYEEAFGYGATRFYSWGVSDFLIFHNQPEQPIIERCYRQMGQWLAIASTFSLGDLHIENVRIAKYLAYLIDLEISLTEAFAGVGQTLLLSGALGGINGELNDAEEFVYVVTQTNTGTPTQRIDFNRVYIDKYFQNRLYAMRGLVRKLVPVNAYYLFTGLRNGMNVMRAVEQANGFNAWFARLNNVLVRVLPVGTQDWILSRRNIYVNAVRGLPPPTVLANVMAQELRAELTIRFNNYLGNPTPEPEFMVLAAPASATDLQNFDIPAFYHRIGTSDLLDSSGNVLAVPAAVTVDNPAPPPATVALMTNVGRLTYYAAPPTAANVRVGQITPLATPAFFVRRLLLRTQAMAALNVLVPPAGPGVLIP